MLLTQVRDELICASGTAGLHVVVALFNGQDGFFEILLFPIEIGGGQCSVKRLGGVLPCRRANSSNSARRSGFRGVVFIGLPVILILKLDPERVKAFLPSASAGNTSCCRPERCATNPLIRYRPIGAPRSRWARIFVEQLLNHVLPHEQRLFRPSLWLYQTACPILPI
jgi:hypothetical protein